MPAEAVSGAIAGWRCARVAVVTIVAGLALAACGGGSAPAGASAVNVYSGRHYDADRTLFDEFTAETGIKVNVIEAGGDELIERLAREGEESPADVFITADAGILWRAEQRGVLQPLGAPEILARVPERLRHPEGLWVGVTTRARVFVVNRELGAPPGLDAYADLADPTLGPSICVRPSSNVYNQSLLASIIAHEGEAAAEAWAAGVAANFARKPQGNDTAQIEAVAAGLCRVGIVNSYYVARFLETDDPEAAAIGAKISVIFPNQGEGDRGAHVNVSGLGLAAHAPHPENARKLAAFLLRDDIQARFALGNNEYPAVAGVEATGPISSLGAFRADALATAELGRNQPAAIRIFDRVGWP